MRLKRLLYLGHRWLGIILCLFMAMWFVSGVVMMYVGYPKLTSAERLAAARPLEASGCCVAGAALVEAAAKDGGLRSLRLVNAGGDPRFIASASRNSLTAIHALSGDLVAASDATQVRATASQFARGAPVTEVIQVEEDAWTHSRALDPFRPLWRASVQDPNLAYVYVSGRTGEVVRDVTTTERNWNWVGAWLHWLYPLRGGWLDRWWTEIVVYLSLVATVLAITGLVVGILRWRLQPYRSGSRSPYRTRMMRWHHWGGLIFGVLAVTWIASGLFSMNPWKIFSPDVPKMPESRIPVSAGTAESAGGALQCFSRHGFEARELEWRRLGEDVQIEVRNGSGGLLLLRANGRCEPLSHLDAAAIEREAERLMPHARKLAVRVQQEYDWNYYARAVHSMTGHFEKPLPVLVVEFDDPYATTLYMDLRNGRLLQHLDDRRRVKRWLFAFFHSWDWLPLLDRRPLWDVLLIVGSIGGLLISLTGIVIGWRRLIR
jgi:hypothetical protein